MRYICTNIISEGHCFFSHSIIKHHDVDVGMFLGNLKPLINVRKDELYLFIKRVCNVNKLIIDESQDLTQCVC